MDQSLSELEGPSEPVRDLALLVPTPQELPFRDLGWERFEKLCYRLARLEHDVEDPRGYGVPGQADRGVDILARRVDGRYVAYQCKDYRRLRPRDIEDAVTVFLENRWDIGIAQFVLCTTHSCVDRGLADAIVEQGRRLAREGISFVVWDREALSARLKELPELIRDIYGRWVLAQFLPDYDGTEETPPACAEDTEAYLRALHEHCTALPSWFPQGMKFTEILHEVTVRPPAVDAEEPEAPASSEAQRRVPWRRAMQQLRHVLLIGDPGSGKSWAIRSRAVELAAARLEGSADGGTLPMIVLAPKLEEGLRSVAAGADGGAQLTRALAMAMPDEVVATAGAVEVVTAALSRDEPVDLMIDGYDEIRSERPRLAQRLGEIVGHLGHGSRFVLTTRPATVPQQRFARMVAACELQPFREPDQRQFVEAWFGEDSEQGRTLARWVSERRLDLLRTPLLIALFCAAATTRDTAPPQTEPELLQRALQRLASNQERYEPLEETSELVRQRIALLEEIAGAFVMPAGIVDAVSVASIEELLSDHAAWRQLERLTKTTVIDDLTSTGVVRKVMGSSGHELEYLHSALRDYLLARLLARRSLWPNHLWRLWSQPEWEPVIGYVGALLEDPDELLAMLQSSFVEDPLNAARLTAGRVLLAAWPKVGDTRRNRVRGELLALLASHDEIDRNRSAAVLASMQDDESVALVRALVQPDVPTRVVVAALRTIAGGTSVASIDALTACARSDEYTPSERVAAVEALSDTSTAHALAALEQLTSDADVLPQVRAAAAFLALRTFDADTPSVRLLERRDEDSRKARGALMERLVAEEDALGDFLGRLRDGEVDVLDPYCSALLESSGPDPGDGLECVMRALPSNPAADVLVAAVERLRELQERDPFTVVLARFLLERRCRPDGRWTLATHIGESPAESAGELVRSLGSSFTANEHLDLAAFLIGELEELPEALAEALRRAIEDDEFGPFARLALANQRSQATAAGHAPALRSPDGGGDDAPLPAPHDDIAAVLSERLSPLGKYQLLRELRRTLPNEGDVFRQAAWLTDDVTIGTATSWIDAQPTLAPLVEARLRRSQFDTARVELAELRSRWPGRGEEVWSTVSGLDARVLDARAEAALLSDDLDVAGTMALASIGAREAEERSPTNRSVMLLLAAGGPHAFSKVSWCLERMPLDAPSTLLLLSWCQAAMRDFSGVSAVLERLPGYLHATDANVAALRVLTGLPLDGAFDRVISWSGCKRVSALLAAIATFAPSEPLQERIAQARQVLEAHSAGLAARWPTDPLEPGDHGTPRWADVLVEIAGKLLSERRPEAAVEIYAAAVEKQGDHPTLVNNLGFCQVPLDLAAAQATLDRAAALYTRPFSVNVANRMLVRTLRGNHPGALAIGESYYEQSATARDGAWLWDMDDPSVLRTDVDVLRYISELGCKAATIVGDRASLARWRRRLAQRPEDPT